MTTEPCDGQSDAQPEIDDSPKEDREDSRVKPLLGQDELQLTVEQWRHIQEAFVDEPRQSVEQADALVADLLRRLARSLEQERKQVQAFIADTTTSTEDMRQGLRRYRALFERLIAA